MSSDCHFSRLLTVTQSEAYQYFSDIEKYPERYPQYYQTIDVVERTDNSLTAKMFLNVNLSIEEDHANIIAKFTFKPETEIRYEVTSGPGQGIIKNAIIIRGQDTLGDKAYKSAVEMNHIPLDLLCYPPPYMYEPEDEKYKDYIISPGERLGEYQKMLTYFMEQDLVPLEKKGKRFEIDDLCNKCKKGHLQFYGKKEEYDIRKEVYFRCDYCGSEFSNKRVDL